MPELPDLEVVKEVLQRRLLGRRIESVRVLRPLVLRVLEAGSTPEEMLQGRTVAGVERAGKWLLLSADDDAGAPRTYLSVNCMLAGRLWLVALGARPRARDYLALRLSDAGYGPEELRYHDPKGMGKLYLTRDLATIPGYTDMGPDALDPRFTLDRFLAGLRRHPGEIKGALTRGAVVAGIGNAYADEILFRAGIYPFRRGATLTPKERAAVYEAIGVVLREAIATLRQRVGDAIEVEVRDFMLVHGRAGQPCSRCGQIISEVTGAGRMTHFCRRCQPGSLLAR